MPFLLSIRLETMQPTPTAGNLTLIDLGSPVMEPSGLTSQCPQSDLTQSVQNLRKIAMILGSGSTIRTLPSHNSPLALLTSEFIGGQAKTAFLFHLAHEHPSLADCRATLDLIELLRQIRCRETVNRVDHRVQYFNEKADHYRSLYRNLDAERTDFGTQLADREADLRRLQAKLDDQSTANRRQEQDFQNQLAQIRQQQTKFSLGIQCSPDLWLPPSPGD
ncbi:hypothetical protein BJ085DRAFT_29758 [Dimargaris cristalligena]|uniref:Kinesin motor domain-containing protein n=1 Tax=Dimargaris cristalligena TaxID=215637 RepID=A0A4P9ZY18_9FUNG|nr:hypothetical protein BJ085DRAFT_29758 [Dimargaris cristalligena]|eukprot:RKP37650.1 hypothetical protein BJ085DRAFT_29758 [Dimargaris cristalligena]